VKEFLPFLLWTLLSPFPTIQEKFNIYFLSIGAAHYEHDSKKFSEKNFIPYDDLPEANFSATVMAKVLQKYATAKGITLQSTDKNMLTKKRILSAVDSLGRLLAKAPSKNALLVVYYCGHGISENLGWNQFLIPGNYTKIAGTKKIDDLTNDLIYLGDITDKLDKLNKRYVVLIDCCRKEEVDNSLPEARLRYFFDERKLENLRSMVAVVKFINEYHSINPVVFSIAPGELAPTVDLPDIAIVKSLNVQDVFQVGPVCRRLLLTLQSATRGPLSLSDIIKGLIDPALDRDQSPISVSFYRKEEDTLANSHLFMGF